jgi:plasmid stabilization system protein ParE
MRVVITAAAKADLLAVRRTIGADDPSRAVSFVEELLDRCLALADTPKAYPLVPRFVSEALVKHERATFLSGNDRVDTSASSSARRFRRTSSASPPPAMS